MRRLLLVLLPAVSAAAGEWTELFDGKTLEGWTTVGGRYDGRAVWTVADGAIVGREGPNRAGGLLYTKDAYRNVEIELETKLTWPFDSGVFLRMRPGERGMQVTLDHRPGGEIGGLYSDGWVRHNPAGAALFRRDAWNTVKVRCVGDPMHVTVWLNGALLTDFRLPEGGGTFARDGLIGLQVHGARADTGEARFRKIRVRRLPDDAGRYFAAGAGGLLGLTEAGRAAGWRALDLEEADGFRTRDGVLALLTKGAAPFARSKKDYRDFHLRLEFKTARMANSGVFLRVARDATRPSTSGCEIQILDDFNWEKETGGKLKAWQFTGSLYGAVAAGKKALRPIGEWNTLEATFRGSRLLTALNGRTLYDVDTHRLAVLPPFVLRAKEGFIGIQRHAPKSVEGEAYAWFRNLYVREIAR